jgi:hypothetical protein
MMSASAMLACHGEYIIGGPTDGGPGPGTGSGSGGGGGGGGGGTGLPDGSVVLSEPDGGTLVIAPQTIVVNKVDLLFMIDNSASMGDKQAYLNAAIPDLVSRLVTPNCLDDTTQAVVGPSTIDSSGVAQCPSGSTLEFPAVHDMHIGIVSSSLGPRLGDQDPADGSGGVCLPTATISINGATLNNHNDDQGHLIVRSSDPTLAVTAAPTEVPLADGATGTPGAVGSGFLAWFPNNPANTGSAGTGVFPETSSTQLISDFSDLIAGVHEYGCGIESQLESWYRFLIQPDPYASLTLINSKGAWVGVDTTIIQERHDFLRPDSLVAIVDLTDEDDSEIDVRSIGGQGYLFMSTKFYPPHGTSECAANPADPNCTSCQLLADPSSDPACGTSAAPTNYNAPTDWGYDLNLRHVHMQAKYGINPQFPIVRYQNGLASTMVPDRTGEYPTSANGLQVQNYVGTNDCTNPLYAATLPSGASLSANVATQEQASDATTLCNLPKGSRTPGLVYFLHIGGVPASLLHVTPGNPAANELSSADWAKILGNDPFNYDYTGIDPHMIESYQPRPGLPTAPSAPAATNPDPISGYEWITNMGPHLDLNVDREYACIFQLTTPRDCSKDSTGAYNVPSNGYSCDCSSTGLSAQELSPVCSPTTPTTQLYAKAYPTIRELELAKLLGPQGIVASICPIDVADNTTGTDPLYGYRPAVSNLVDRMRPTLAFTGQ